MWLFYEMRIGIYIEPLLLTSPTFGASSHLKLLYEGDVNYISRVHLYTLIRLTYFSFHHLGNFWR